MTDRYDNCERLGAILVGEALKTCGQIEVGPSVALGVARRRLDLPLRPLDPIDEIERERFLLARAERALAEARAGRSQAAVPFEVQALRLGDVGLTAAPAELFVEIGLGIKRRSPFPATMTLGYANGCFGYVPVAEAYPDGGYEVDRAHKVQATKSARKVRRLARRCGTAHRGPAESVSGRRSPVPPASGSPAPAPGAGGRRCRRTQRR